ncbi:MAG: ATP-dependent helicase, partial [Synechocystis sp.]|nr:ATP-dependent helicase [Synechocystis sp.]
MATLHGNWQISSPHGSGNLFLWADSWGSRTPKVETPDHPFALVDDRLWDFFQTLPLALPALKNADIQSQLLTLPSGEINDILAPLVTGQNLADQATEQVNLHPWQVPGVGLTPLQTVTLLQSIPLGGTLPGTVGQEFYFYAHLYRWCLDLVVRGKFLPGLRETAIGYEAVWLPLLDSTQDQTRLAQFTQAVPPCCLAVPLPETVNPPQTLVLDLLQQLVQAQITHTSPSLPSHKEPWLQTWLTGLTKADAQPCGSGKAMQRLSTVLDHWCLPVQAYLAQRENQALAQRQFRGALKLLPPVKPDVTWRLAYGLQALDDDQFWVPAEAIWSAESEPLLWQGRTINQPEESLLRGLGVAADLYDPIA